jgi:hypothetical protein
MSKSPDFSFSIFGFSIFWLSFGFSMIVILMTAFEIFQGEIFVSAFDGSFDETTRKRGYLLSAIMICSRHFCVHMFWTVAHEPFGNMGRVFVLSCHKKNEFLPAHAPHPYCEPN